MHAYFEIHKSVEVLLACRWHLFPGHNIEERLEGAFDSFHSWCVAEGKKSSLRKFELKIFKMSSCLGLRLIQHMHEGMHCISCMCSTKCVCASGLKFSNAIQGCSHGPEGVEKLMILPCLLSGCLQLQRVACVRVTHLS